VAREKLHMVNADPRRTLLVPVKDLPAKNAGGAGK